MDQPRTVAGIHKKILFDPMTATVFAALLAAILLPIIFILWLTESKQQRAKRLRKTGLSYAKIAAQIGVSATTARKYALA